MFLMDSTKELKDTSPVVFNSVHGMSREALGVGDSTLFSCGNCDLEQVRKIVHALFSGLAVACIANTMGDLFKTPASVAANLKKEMIEYLRQQSKAYATEYLSSLENLDSPESPIEVVDDLIENFVHNKRNFFTRVSGWLLSEQEEDKIDDFEFEMDKRGFWVKGHREVLAKELVKFIDLNRAYHCDMKFASKEDFELHKSRCPLRPVHCTNEGCKEVFCALYAKDHDALCPLKLIPCEQNCSALLNRAEMDKHCITVCPMKVVNCPFYQVGCQSAIPHASIEEHCIGFLQSHMFYVLKMLHRQEESVEDLSQHVILLEKSFSQSQRSEAVDISSLSLIMREQEAKMKILEQDVAKLRKDMKTADVSAEVLQLCRNIQSLQKQLSSQSLQ